MLGRFSSGGARLWLGGVLLVTLLLAAPSSLWAQKAEKKEDPTLLQADKITYDEKAEIVTALGHVEVSQGEQILRADKITYHQKTSVVQAEGHVSVLQATGDVLFAEKAELTSDMKEAFIKNVRVLFQDSSRLSAHEASRYQGRYLIAEKGVYSACDLCKDDPLKPPFWQMKAARITHDNEKKNIMYRDVFLEFWGTPVFYSPYFSHPDPTVTRRQGFLNPTTGYNETLGYLVRTPYYFDIAPNTDLLVTPVFSETDKVMLGGELRHRFENGETKWNGSFARSTLIDESGVDKGKQWRGHLVGSTRFDLNNEWRAGTEVAFTSDKSYLKRYNLLSQDVLVNRAFVEGFRGRHYAVANTYYFQDLRPEAQQTEPFILPDVSFSALGEPGKTLGGRWSLDGGLLVTMRDQSGDPVYHGPDTRRLAMKAGWERQIISSTGLLTNLSAFARLDGYWASHIPDPSVAAGTNFNETLQVRQFAQTDLTFRYPLGQHGDGYRQILEPITVVSAAPMMDSDETLPNEDSLDVEFDETNLFLPSRYTGIDRLEGGTRVAYGLRHALIGDNGAKIEAVGGQIFRIEKDKNFPAYSGLDNSFSDYVGRLDFSPAPWFDSSYRFRLDRVNFSFQRQELQASAGVDLFKPFINYLNVRQTEATTGASSTIEEVSGGFTSKFADYWRLSASHRYALRPTRGPRQSSASISYQDECFATGVSAVRDETNREDLQSGTTFMFHLYLRNIGGFQNDSGVEGAYATPHLNIEETDIKTLR